MFDVRKMTAADRIVKAALLVMACMLALYVFLIRDISVLNETDLYRIAFSSLYELKNNLPLGDSGLTYGLNFSYAYHLLLYALEGRSDPTAASTILMMNQIGLVAAIVMFPLFAVEFARRYGLYVASVACALFFFSHCLLDLITSGHPVLPALAFVFVGAFVLRIRTGGRVVEGAIILGASVMLVLALAMRADVALAFPWLVLGRDRDDRWTLPEFARRVVATCLALALFLYGQGHFVQSTGSAEKSFTDFLSSYFHVNELILVIPTFFLGFGIASLTILGGLIVARTVRPGLFKAGLPQPLIDVAVLVLPALVFWAADPLPSRHFILAFMGLALAIGLLIERLSTSRTIGLALVVACLFSNEALAEIVNPILIRHARTPYVEVPGLRRTFGNAQSGFIGFHVSANAKRRRLLDELARTIATACDDRILVLTDEVQELAMPLIDGKAAITIRMFQPVPKEGTEIDRGAQRFRFIRLSDERPKDVLPDILTDDQYRGYAIVVDPYSVLVGETTQVPADRKPKFGSCS